MKPITQTSFCVFKSKWRLASPRGTSKSQLIPWILLQSHSYSFAETLWDKKRDNIPTMYEKAYEQLPHINHLKTKRRLLYLKTQSVPRSKYFSSRL